MFCVCSSRCCKLSFDWDKRPVYTSNQRTRVKHIFKILEERFLLQIVVINSFQHLFTKHPETVRYFQKYLSLNLKFNTVKSLGDDEHSMAIKILDILRDKDMITHLSLVASSLKLLADQPSVDTLELSVKELNRYHRKLTNLRKEYLRDFLENVHLEIKKWLKCKDYLRTNRKAMIAFLSLVYVLMAPEWGNDVGPATQKSKHAGTEVVVGRYVLSLGSVQISANMRLRFSVSLYISPLKKA